MIRILQVIGSMNCGGAETMLMNLYRHIDRNVVQFDFVVHTSDKAAYDEEILELGGRFFRCPHYNGKNHLAYVTWWKRFFREHIGEYPVVHGHIGSTAAIYLSIARKAGRYTIAHSHSTNMGPVYRIYSYPVRHIADHFFGCGQQAATARYGKRVAGNVQKCTILPNAIDLEKFAFNEKTRLEMRQQLDIHNELLMGHVGRFHEAKNHRFLLDIFAELVKITPEAKLLLLGDGTLRTEIEEKIESLGLRNSVTLTGVRSNVNDYLQAMDVVVFPSLYEGLPVSMIEAQANGIQCVLSDTIPEQVKMTDCITFLPLTESPKTWAQHILEKAKEPRYQTQEQLRNAGYDIEATSKWLQDFYVGVSKHG